MDKDVTANAENPAANAATDTTVEVEAASAANAVENTDSNSKARLLDESKKWKQRAIEAEKKLQDQTLAEHQKQGKFKELYEASETKYKTLLKTLVDEKVSGSVKEVAGKMNCISSEAAMKLGNKSLLVIDNESLEVTGVETFMDDLKKNHPYLFNNKVAPTVNPSVPPTPLASDAKLTKEEFMKLPPEQRKKIIADGANSIMKGTR
jgi:hypothetical protein